MTGKSLKWLHTVVEDEVFVSPWRATWDALLLQREVHSLPEERTLVAHRTKIANPQRSKCGPLRLRFSQFETYRVCDADCDVHMTVVRKCPSQHSEQYECEWLGPSVTEWDAAFPVRVPQPLSQHGSSLRFPPQFSQEPLSAKAVLIRETEEQDAVHLMQGQQRRTRGARSHTEPCRSVSRSPRLEVHCRLPDLPDAILQLDQLWAGNPNPSQPFRHYTRVLSVWFLDARYSHYCPAARTVELQHAPDFWEDTILSAWTDLVDTSVPFEVHLVASLSLQQVEPESFAHTIVRQFPQENQRAIFLSFRRRTLAGLDVVNVAVLTEALIQWSHLEHWLQRCATDHVWPLQQIDAIFRNTVVVWTSPSHFVPLEAHHGDVLELHCSTVIEVGGLPQNCEADVSSFMQRITGGPSRRLVAVALMRRGRTWINTQVRSRPPSSCRSDVAEALHLQHDQVQAIHEVTTPVPGFFPHTRPWIVQEVGDLEVDYACSLVLVDVVLYPPGTVIQHPVPETVRKVRRTPAALTRADLLRVAQVEHYCASQRHRCLVRHNDQQWLLQDLAVRVAAHGDYFVVIVPPAAPVQTGNTCVDVLQADCHSADTDTEGGLDAMSDRVSPDEITEEPSHDIAEQPSDHQPADLRFCVWVIVHGSYLRCTVPRLVATTFDSAHWLQDIMRTWSDVLQPRAPTAVHLVMPQPTGAPAAGTHDCVHLLVEQGMHQSRRAALVSVYDPTGSFQGPVQAAWSLASQVTASIVAGSVSLPSDIRLNQGFSLSLHGRIADFDRILPCPGGANFALHVHDAHAPVEATDVSLMQQSFAVSSALDVPVESVTAGNDSMLSASSGGSCGHESDTCQNCIVFSSWYLDHQRFPACAIPRDLRLCSQLRDWIERFEAVWGDRYDRSQAFQDITAIYFLRAFHDAFRPAKGSYIVLARFPSNDVLALMQQAPGHLVKGHQLEPGDDFAHQGMSGGPVKSGISIEGEDVFPEACTWQPESSEDEMDETSDRYRSYDAHALVEWWTIHGVRTPLTDAEGPRFISYFLAAPRFPVCSQPRLFRPGRILDADSWQDLMCRIWHDRCQVGQQLHFYVARPQPPSDGEGPYIHLLVSPRLLDDQVPVLVSTKTDPTQPWSHVAYLVRRFVNRFGLLTMTNLAPMCFSGRHRRACHVWHGDTLLYQAGEVNAAPGDSFRVLVEHPRVSPEDQGHTMGQESIDVLTQAREVASAFHGPAFVPVHTWFIHHESATRCDESRIVGLGIDPTMWARDICVAWQEVCDAGKELLVSIITPQPDRIFDSPHTIHVMVEQHGEHTQHLKAALFSVDQAFRFTHFARSVMPHLRYDMIVHYVNLDHACLGDQPRFDCQVTWRRRPVTPLAFLNVPSGAWFYVRVFPRASGGRATEETPQDAVVMMQLAPVGESQIPGTVEAPVQDPPFSGDSQGGAMHDAGASSSQPHDGHVNLWNVWSTSLDHLAFNLQQTIELPPFAEHVRDSTHFDTVTYLISGNGFRQCHLPRRVEYRNDVTSWLLDLFRTWRDLIDFGASTEVYVVSPQPLGVPGVHEGDVHILVVQHRPPETRAALVSVLQEGQGHNVACFVPNMALKAHIIVAAGGPTTCYNPALRRACHAWYLGYMITDQLPVLITNGHGILLGIAAESETAGQHTTCYNPALRRACHAWYLGYMITDQLPVLITNGHGILLGIAAESESLPVSVDVGLEMPVGDTGGTEPEELSQGPPSAAEQATTAGTAHEIPPGHSVMHTGLVFRPMHITFPPRCFPHVVKYCASGPVPIQDSVGPVKALPTYVSDDLSLLQKPLVRPLKLQELIPDEPDGLKSKAGVGRTVCFRGLQALSDCLLNRTCELCREVPLRAVFRASFPCTDWLLHDMPSLPFVRYEIHTDGSNLWRHDLQQMSAGWAFHVVGFLADMEADPLYIGAQWGLCDPAELPDPETLPDALDGECEAMYRALLWCCQSADFQAHVPFAMVSDSQILSHAAQGFWSPDSKLLLRTKIRPLFDACQRLGTLTLRWQRAHSGQVLNELCDHLAKIGARGFECPVPTCCVPADLCPWFSWIAILWSSELVGIGPQCEGDLFFFERPPRVQGRDAGTFVMEVDGLGLEPLHEDHLSVTCDLQIDLQQISRWTAPPSVTAYDREALKTVEGSAMTQTTLHAFLDLHESQLWQQSSDSTVCAVHRWFNGAMSRLFPRPRHKTDSTWISEHTWQQLCLSRYLRRHATSIRARLRVGFLRAIFQAWRQQRAVYVVRSDDEQTYPPPSPKWLMQMFDLLPWFHYILDAGARWKAMCKKASRIEGSQLQLKAVHVLTELPAAMVSSQEVSSQEEDQALMSVDLGHVCTHCGKSFESYKSLSVHCLLAHQQTAPARAYMPFPSTCACCLRDFYTTQRLRQHLQYARGACLPLLRSIWFPMTQQEIQDVVALPQKQSAHRLVPFRVSGPCLPSLMEWQTACPNKRFPGLQAQADVAPMPETYEMILVDWLLTWMLGSGCNFLADLADL
eukprot:Skav225113  [mRNA]  locus=scaffold6354:112097:122521:+ [translate_table: standard]